MAQLYCRPGTETLKLSSASMGVLNSIYSATAAFFTRYAHVAVISKSRATAAASDGSGNYATAPTGAIEAMEKPVNGAAGATCRNS